ncbi:MAG: c-type cytochrome [Bauldia sp.]|nr:c-type cytochrome [Bauldia sp.]
MTRPALLSTAALVAGAASIAIAAAPVDRPDLDPADIDRIAAIVAPTSDFTRAENFEANQGGATTTMRLDRDAFSQPAANLDFAGRADFSVGNGVFRKLWVSAPSSTAASDGLGPLFNARGCQECHIKDGRGHPPAAGATDAVSFVVGLSAPHGGGAAFAFGGQLQDFGVPGLPSEGRIAIAWTEEPVTLAGGETVSLRVPSYSVTEGGFGPLPEGTLLSPRIAPQMIGLGLIEAIHPNDILARADPADADGDGISGRVHWVTDIATGEPAIGRFGWKAAQPSIADQSATAFAMDMGLSTALVPRAHGDCGDLQPACLALPTGNPPGGFEVAPELFDVVVFYAGHLGVPVRRDFDDPTVLAGKALFYGTGCTACHTPKYVTSNDPSVPATLRRQLIWPYTDLLLHDMGDGLADGRPQGDATGAEWRTPPLWGIGLTATVNGEEAGYLHDGRARTLIEAILWHGGEAAAARDAVVGMTPEQRAALIRFLESL